MLLRLGSAGWPGISYVYRNCIFSSSSPDHRGTPEGSRNEQRLFLVSRAKPCLISRKWRRHSPRTKPTSWAPVLELSLKNTHLKHSWARSAGKKISH